MFQLKIVYLHLFKIPPQFIVGFLVYSKKALEINDFFWDS